MKSRVLFKLCFCLIIAIIFVGCATTTPTATSTGVFSSGKDTYTLVLTGYYETIGELQKKAYQEANYFCESKGKMLQPIAHKAVPPGLSNQYRPSFELRFRALYPDDPDYKRPDLEPVPDVKIDVKGK